MSDWQAEWRRFLRFWGADPKRDADEELRFHIESSTDELVAAGMSRDEARESAARRFGNVRDISQTLYTLGQQREQRMQRAEWFDTLRQDLVFALRQLRKSPGFTAVALLTLALGIGSNTAIFSVVYGVLLKPLPYASADRIVSVREGTAGPGSWSIATYGDFDAWRTRTTRFEVVAAYTGSLPYTLTGARDPVPVTTMVASAEYWKAMYIPPSLGRYFTAADDHEGAAPVVVVSYALWKNRFGGDSSIIGRAITLNGQQRMVVAVASPEYILTPPAERIWVPLAPPASRLADHSDHELTVYAVVRRGVTVADATRELSQIQAGIAKQYKGSGVADRIFAISLADAIVGPQRTLLLTLLGAVTLVLFIVCANVANLLIARSAVRRTEMAIRGALGASRGRIVAQLLVESLVLAVAGGALGVAVAVAGIRFLVTSPASMPRLQSATLDGPVLAFTFVLSVGCAVIFGLLPALRATRLDLQQALRDGGRDLTGSVRERSRAVLVVGELCLTQVLVVAAGLLIRSALLLQSVPPGFEASNLLVANVLLPSARYATDAAREAGFQQIQDALAAVPGVKSVGRTMIAPIHGGGWDCATFHEGATRDDPSAVDANVRNADPNYFSAIGTPLLRGRAFTRGDVATGAPVAIVNETLARELFGRADPIGRRVANCVGGDKTPAWHEIVGVVGDMHARGLANDVPAEMYYPSTQFVHASMSFVVRGSVPVTTLLPGIRRAVAGVDPLLALSAVSTMENAISRSLALPRFTMWLLTLLGVTGLILALVGVYGVIAYIVTQRTREVGIRIALGADGREIQWMLIRQGLMLGVAGVLIGSAASLAVTRFLGSMMFGVTAHDPVTFAVVAVLLILVSVCASWLPARRAARIDPLIALRG